MSHNASTRLIALFAGLSLAACAARGADDPEPPKLRFGIALNAKPAKNHLQDAVQRSPDFALIDGNKTIKPGRAGYIYRIERADGDRLLLTAPSRGLYGWAQRNSVIPYSEAEGYFTNALET